MDKRKVRRILLIAYHFPPVGLSSGLQRTLSFARHLSSYGWQPMVLTIHPRAYQARRDDQLTDIPGNLIVTRAFGLDSARQLALAGHYFSWTALPDRWVSWWIGGVTSGLRLIQRYRPTVIWSTYPIASAHLIGLTLQRFTGLPWVADFRDSMTEEGYPPDPTRRRIYRWIERRTVARCTCAVFTTPGAVQMYRARYPVENGNKWRLIANGYDERNFERAEALARRRISPRGRLRLVHSGVLYPSERDPRPFFAALANLKARGIISRQNLEVVLRATGHDDYHRGLLTTQGLDDLVVLEPGIAYEAALLEMLESDGLLLFQAANCNHQIPAKVYEYLRARRPILALTDSEGDTARLLRDAGVDTIVPLDDANAIAAALSEFLGMIKQGNAPLASESVVTSYSRRQRTEELATILNEVAG